MFQRSFHLTCRVGCLAAILILLGSVSGCAMWDRDRWNIDRLRDDRAVEIDHRLKGADPAVQNPF